MYDRSSKINFRLVELNNNPPKVIYMYEGDRKFLQTHCILDNHGIYLFVCVEVLRPCQPNCVMSSSVSLPNHTFTGKAYSSKQLTSIVHILSTTALIESAEGREWPYKIFHDQSPRKNVADFGGDWTRDLLVSSRKAHPTEPPRPEGFTCTQPTWNKWLIIAVHCV